MAARVVRTRIVDLDDYATLSGPADATVGLRALGPGSGKAAHGWAEKARRVPGPSLLNLVAWTVDPATATAASGALTAGKGYMGRMPVPVDISCTGFVFEITNTPGTSSNCFAAVYSRSGTTATRQAVSSDQSSLWASSGIKLPTWGAVSLTGGDAVDAVGYFLFGSTTTAPQVLATQTNTTRGNANLTAGTDALRFGSAGTSLTAAPSPTIDLTTAAMTMPIFMGLQGS